MNLCRICLSSSTNRDICELKIAYDDINDSKSFSEILLFCLDIQVTESQKITTKLCSQCFIKILSYHEFKTLALKNDCYLRKLNVDDSVKLEIGDKEDEISNDSYSADQIQESNKCNTTQLSDNELSIADYFKKELLIKAETLDDNDKKVKEEGFSAANNILPSGEVSTVKVKTKSRGKKSKEGKKGAKRHVCKECGESVANLRKHSSKHLPNQERKQFKCDECDKVFFSNSACQKHHRIKHLGIKEKCEICDKEVNCIKKHMSNVHKKSKGSKVTQESNESKKQMCGECGESVINLKKHAIKHLPIHERRHIKCKACDKTFCSNEARHRHYKIQHLGIKPRCEVCDKEVTCLKKHMLRMHSPEKLKVACMLCEKRFLSPSLLEVHMLHHTKAKPFECDICHQKFRLKVVLSYHIRKVHENEKSHLCQYCSKSYFRKDHLMIHLRSHTKEKPYKCEECGLGFSNSSGYRVHKEIHSSEKKYQCEYCDMKFVRKDYLRAHTMIHTKEKRYPCKYCGLRFGRADHRKRHQYTAHEKHQLGA